MCSNNSESTFSSALVWPCLLGWALLVSACTAQVTHLRLLNTSLHYARLRSPLLTHQLEMQRENVFALRPRRLRVPGRNNWLTR